MVYETLKSILFYLDTRVRSSGTVGSPNFTFPNNLIGLQPQNGELIRLTMQEASIEYTFYQTELFNNRFLRQERLNGQTDFTNEIVEVAIGNYNLLTFILALTDALNQNSLYRYRLVYIPETNQIRYIATPIAGIIGEIRFNFNQDSVFSIIGVDIQESLSESMGFPENSIITLGPVVQNNTIECQSIIPITMSPGVENLYVTISNSCSNYGNANIANVFTASNILAKIPVSNPPFSTLYFYDLNSNFSTIITNKYLDNLNLTLFNERFTQIEPRKDWTFTIKIEIIRPKIENDTKNLLSELVEITKLKFLKKNKNNTEKEKK